MLSGGVVEGAPAHVLRHAADEGIRVHGAAAGTAAGAAAAAVALRHKVQRRLGRLHLAAVVVDGRLSVLFRLRRHLLLSAVVLPPLEVRGCGGRRFHLDVLLVDCKVLEDLQARSSVGSLRGSCLFSDPCPCLTDVHSAIVYAALCTAHRKPNRRTSGRTVC